MKGIFLMTAAIAVLSAMDAIAKWLSMNDVTVIQILALRSIVIIPVMICAFLLQNRVAELRPVSIKKHALRGSIGFVSPLCFFLGIQYIPLTDAVVLFFSSTFMVTMMSMFFLGEKVGWHRWASIIAGFAGVLVVATPKGEGLFLGYCLVLIGSATYSILFVSGKYLSKTETVASLVFSYNLCVGIISLSLLAWFWQPLNSTQIQLIAILAILALAGHYLITLAFAVEDASLIVPFEYSALIWAILFDFFIWQTYPDSNTLIGASVIISSGLYIIHRERIRANLSN